MLKAQLVASTLSGTGEDAFRNEFILRKRSTCNYPDYFLAHPWGAATTNKRLIFLPSLSPKTYMVPFQTWKSRKGLLHNSKRRSQSSTHGSLEPVYAAERHLELRSRRHSNALSKWGTFKTSRQGLYVCVQSVTAPALYRGHPTYWSNQTAWSYVWKTTSAAFRGCLDCMVQRKANLDFGQHLPSFSTWTQ